MSSAVHCLRWSAGCQTAASSDAKIEALQSLSGHDHCVWRLFTGLRLAAMPGPKLSMCCLSFHTLLVTWRVLAQYRLCLLGNASTLAMAALLLAISQFRFAAVLLLSMNYQHLWPLNAGRWGVLLALQLLNLCNLGKCMCVHLHWYEPKN